MNKLIITNATNTAMNAYRECKAFIYNAKELFECNNPASFSRLFKLACLNLKDYGEFPMNKFAKIAAISAIAIGFAFAADGLPPGISIIDCKSYDRCPSYSSNWFCFKNTSENQYEIRYSCYQNNGTSQDNVIIRARGAMGDECVVTNCSSDNGTIERIRYEKK